MPKFAMINGNVVENIIVANNKEATEKSLHCTLIEITNENPLGIGWTLVDGVWQPPVELEGDLNAD